MKKSYRWIFYVSIGILFGVFDVFYQDYTTKYLTSTFSWLIIAWGIWVIPFTVIVINEIKVSMSKFLSIFSGILTWIAALISYYFFIPMRTIFIEQEALKEFYIGNYKADYYLSNVKALFSNSFEGIFLWIIIAIIGGVIVGILINMFYNKFKEVNIQKA
ncbi:hypothetical protein [Clostridium sp. Ade.TY]|uniref:hypothetical protein n=1 Tax=Clostridium sp. Ade.TY TaxID=1391647 RepID=UPI0004169AE2|nr:hypothetical protein [Clostridium sp. Ade.TY]